MSTLRERWQCPVQIPDRGQCRLIKGHSGGHTPYDWPDPDGEPGGHDSGPDR